MKIQKNITQFKLDYVIILLIAPIINSFSTALYLSCMYVCIYMVELYEAEKPILWIKDTM